MKNKKQKLLISLHIALLLSGCELQIDDKFGCEQSTYTRCNNIIKCENNRNINTWHFQQTWFIKPERGIENFGAIFGNDGGMFYHPGIERDGSYCIDNKTIVFRNDAPNTPIERIEIIKLIDGEMVLKFENGEEFTYYNPE